MKSSSPRRTLHAPRSLFCLLSIALLLLGACDDGASDGPGDVMNTDTSAGDAPSDSGAQQDTGTTGSLSRERVNRRREAPKVRERAVACSPTPRKRRRFGRGHSTSSPPRLKRGE